MPMRNDWIRHLKIKNSIRGIPIVGLLIDEFRAYQTKRIEAPGTETLFCYVKDGKINNINYIIKIHLHKIKSELRILNDRECVSNSARHSMRGMPRVLKTPIKLQHSILKNRDQRVPEKIWWRCDPHLFLQTEIIIALELTSWI